LKKALSLNSGRAFFCVVTGRDHPGSKGCNGYQVGAFLPLEAWFSPAAWGKLVFE
jgi:hypothetical protein